MMLDTEHATWQEVVEKITRGTIAFLAFGAHEQHGPHLPLNTDTVLASGLARRLASVWDALLLPPIAYGDAWNNTGFPGTLSLSPETVQALLMDIGRGLQAQGVPALVVVNGHFGNRAPLELTARRLLVQEGFPVLILDYPGLERLAEEICTSEPAAPTFYHADEVETSLMLLLDPSHVHMDRAAAEYPQFPPTFGVEPIRLDTFCYSGVFGDPRPATAEKGALLLDGLVEESLKLVRLFLDAHKIPPPKNLALYQVKPKNES
jgi:creatinine amidohydrolase